MYGLAQQVVATEAGALFDVIDRAVMEGEVTPDAIDHGSVFLAPNPYSGAKQEKVLGLLDLLHGEQVPALTAAFADFAQGHDLFKRVQAGETFIFPSNHLELQDQGFTLGYLHRAAQAEGVDRLEHHITLMIGRLLGYLRLGERSVIDDILRKVGGVLKTFPVSGSEVMEEGVVTEADVLAGCRAAMADPTFRPTYWRQIVGWARRANQERLGKAPKQVRPRDAPQSNRPDDASWRSIMRRWVEEGIWHPAFGPPGGADCPAHIKAEFERAA